MALQNVDTIYLEMAMHCVELVLKPFDTRLGRQALLELDLELDLELFVLKLTHAVGGAELDETRYGQLQHSCEVI